MMGAAFLEDPGVDEFMGFDLTALNVDQAYLSVSSHLDESVTLYTRSHACFGVSQAPSSALLYCTVL